MRLTLQDAQAPGTGAILRKPARRAPTMRISTPASSRGYPATKPAQSRPAACALHPVPDAAGAISVPLALTTLDIPAPTIATAAATSRRGGGDWTGRCARQHYRKRRTAWSQDSY
ncbi:hypothetical protein PSU4_18310 [Pseudonocardia sulfidoxydans NBRC 16205]|uniref:Uncharacterized protein n=1 Tax=Pseudonocardia sulfidoxydans NBRC 16205 TaxID=1223511 RepID=A0A511DEB3_9PSEU|nr:hypothetical protein PSU4_18310 [Pseudonocardia sulfidoxydans NBRC 16205]